MALFVEQYELSKGLFEPKMAGGRLWRNFFRQVGGKRACRPLFAPAAAAPTPTDDDVSLAT